MQQRETNNDIATQKTTGMTTIAIHMILQMKNRLLFLCLMLLQRAESEHYLLYSRFRHVTNKGHIARSSCGSWVVGPPDLGMVAHALA